MVETVQDLIDELNKVTDKSKPIWVWQAHLRYQIEAVDFLVPGIIDLNIVSAGMSKELE